MKKRYKTIGIIGAGALVYGIGVIMGVSLLNGDNSQQTKTQRIAQSKPSYIQTEDQDALTKWVDEIRPAAGNSE